MKKQTDKKKRERRGVEVRIGSEVYTNMHDASLALGYNKDYVRTRLEFNNGIMPDGTEIEVGFKTEQSSRISFRMGSELRAYIDKMAESTGQTRSWVIVRLCELGKKDFKTEYGS